MHGKIVELEASCHQQMQKLLPWLLNGQLAGHESALVCAHLANCPECSTDLAWQRALVAQPLPARSAPDLERAFAAMSARMEASAVAPGARHKQAGWLARLRLAGANWRYWALLVQGGALAALALALLNPDATPQAGAPAYRGLAAPDGAKACRVMVTFQPDTTERELRRILMASGARIVDGPTVTEVYVLSLSAPGCQAQLAALRREPAITLLAPIDGAPGP